MAFPRTYGEKRRAKFMLLRSAHLYALFRDLPCRTTACGSAGSSLNGELYLGKPVLGVVLVPDSVYIAFPGDPGYLIAVVRGIFHYISVRLAQTVVRALMINAYRLCCGQCAEEDPVAALARLCNRLRILKYTPETYFLSGVYL